MIRRKFKEIQLFKTPKFTKKCMGCRHEIEVDLDLLQAHQTLYAKFSVFEVLHLLEFVSDYFQTWQIY